MSRKYIDLKPDFFFYVWLFFAASVFGWMWEVVLYFFISDSYVNRGFLFGPWLPIYGSGAVMLEMLFHKWRDRTILTFVSSMVLCTLLEYLAGWYLELTWGVKWWDYSQMRWNLQGYICLGSSLFFGIGGVLLVCVIAPLFHSFYREMPAWLRISAGLFFIICFVADAAYCAMVPHGGNGITYR